MSALALSRVKFHSVESDGALIAAMHREASLRLGDGSVWNEPGAQEEGRESAEAAAEQRVAVTVRLLDK